MKEIIPVTYYLLLVIIELCKCQQKYDPALDYNIQLARMLNQSSDPDAGPWMSADEQLNVTLKFWIYNIIAVVCVVKCNNLYWKKYFYITESPGGNRAIHKQLWSGE
jgi:hypothetical protein